MKEREGNNLAERRKYIRLETPVNVIYNTVGGEKFYTTVSKNISADGIRLETPDRSLQVSDILELKLIIPGTKNPVHANGKVVWKTKSSLEDNAPYDIGIEFIQIEEDNKNTFLKFLCDILYNLH